MPQNQELTELIADVKEQVLYLQELGVESFDVQLAAPPAERTFRAEPVKEASPQPIVISQASPRAVPVETPSRRPAGSRLAALPSLSNRKTPKVEPGGSDQTSFDKEDKEITVLETAADITVREPTPDESLFGEIGPALPESTDTIETIRADIGNCTRCPLFEGRTQVVHTTGNFDADLMFIGEAPGADEDAQGFPFVGRAGQLLTKIIEGIGYKREDVAIGNINRCRPPGNRAPTLPEAHTCRPFLLREIAVIRPRVIVVMGNTALHNLLDTKAGITRVRGTFQDYFGVKVMPTFHPAYLLRDPHKKREVWEDMKKVRDFLQAKPDTEILL
jgi:uracil-DNA glycosylase